MKYKVGDVVRINRDHATYGGSVGVVIEARSRRDDGDTYLISERVGEFAWSRFAESDLSPVGDLKTGDTVRVNLDGEIQSVYDGWVTVRDPKTGGCAAVKVESCEVIG